MHTASVIISVFILLLLDPSGKYPVLAEHNGIYPFQNTSLSFSARVDDLVSRLTINETILQLSRGGSVYPGPAIPRLGIKPYQWDTECLRGDADAGPATSFPQAIGLSAAFNTHLLYDVAEAVGSEVRAKHIDYMRKHQMGTHTGMSCFSPVINIVRHPLWGRTQETYGEDPYLTSSYATSYVQGLQGNHPRYIRASSGCKHFDAYSGPENIPVSRLGFNAKVPERDLRLTYLPAFKKCVEAGTYNIMCSYNSVNGVPACAHKRLLTDILRKEWGFKGYVISDEGAIEYMLVWHMYKTSPVEIAAASINAGCNLELSPALKQPFYYYLADALKQGLVTKETLIESVKPLFYTRMKLGEFDPPSMNPYSSLNLSIIQSPEHRRLSLKTAMQTFVLLKNPHNILPLRRNFKKIAVVGPMANNTNQLFGDYSATIDPKYTTTPLQGLQALAESVNYAAGCKENKCTSYNASEIEHAVSSSELVIVCLGTGKQMEREGCDRKNLDLPGKQLQLLQDAVKFAKYSQIVVLLFSAGPLDVSWADKSPFVSAMIQCFFPAQTSGQAIYNILTHNGTDSNPAGRLSITWPASMNQVPPMINYSMDGRTYRYFNGEPLYPFGYGLSYSEFSYSQLNVPGKVSVGNPIHLSVTVGNKGPFDGDEVTQIYICWLNSSVPMPKLQLAGFSRNFIPVKKQIEINFIIEPDQMAVWDSKRGFVVEEGELIIYAGGQQPNTARKISSNILQKSVQIVA
ncbi:probable beta-D-xylosidase 6 [Octopus sinensis]|uniref:Probable beta-D-xylosidase 6 n=1 Tax=Octopus sinensis TaxID=2607531 RepID=A0A6P7UAI3_9MOLL|nr:probable beta-D-xylosidase 6 [Octopus sinensis]